MTLDQHITANASDADALAAYEADPANYRPVTSHEVKSWLAANGLRERLDLWLAASTLTLEQVADPANAALVALRSGVKQLLTISAGDTLIVSPGSDHRALADGAAAHPQVPFEAADAARLYALGRIGPTYTLEQVAARRAEMARRDEANAVLSALETYASTVRAQCNAYVAGTADTLPEVPSL